MAADINATFGQLLPSTWRDVGFPASDFVVELRHDLARHAFVDADGANLEGMGRAPLQFSFTIPFYNGTSPAKQETWGGQPLYPNRFRQFLEACQPRTTGFLQHPELGTLQAKTESVRVQWDANRRDGVLVHAVWIETIDDPDDIDPLLGVSPIADAVATAQNLDQIVHSNAELAAKIPKFPQYQPSLGDLIDKVQAAADSVGNLATRAQGAVNQIEYRVDSMRDAVDRLKNAYTWPSSNAIERMAASVNDLRKQLFDSKKKIGVFVTKADSTLAGVAGSIPTDLTGVMKLNPSLLASPVVARGTSVRYYAA